MGSHPINLVARFLLELCALGSVGWFGWARFTGPTRWVAMLALPLVLATLWGVFAVPGDPSRSGSTVVAVPGLVRLLLELAVFTAAVAALVYTDAPRAAAVLGGAVVLHYALSWDRIAWLLRQ